MQQGNKQRSDKQQSHKHFGIPPMAMDQDLGVERTIDLRSNLEVNQFERCSTDSNTDMCFFGKDGTD